LPRARLGLPPRQVQAVEDALEPLVGLGALLGLRVGAGQLLDLDVLEMALGALALQRQVALARRTPADPRHLLAVHVQLDDAVVGDDLVVVPLAAALGPVLARQAPLGAARVRPVRHALRAPDAEQVAVAGGRDAAHLVLVLQVDEHLHLDPAGVPGADGRDRVAPDEQPGVADLRLVDVHPVHLQLEVLVLPVGPQVAGRLAGGDDLAVLHEERGRVAVHVHPAGEVGAVEQRLVAVVGRRGERDGRGERQAEQGGARHGGLLWDSAIRIPRYSLVIVSSRFSSTRATSVYAAQSAIVAPAGGAAFGSFSPVATSAALAPPAANRARCFSSSFTSTASSSAVGLRATHSRNANATRWASVVPPSRIARLPSARAHSTKIVSLSPVSAWSGVLVRVRFTHDCSPTGASKTVRAG